MFRPERQDAAGNAGTSLESGLGVLCREAQADGVPCAQLGIACADCPRGWPCAPADREWLYPATLSRREPDA